MASDAQAASVESDTPSPATCRILLVGASKSNPGQYRKSLEAGSMKPAVDVADDADVAKKLLAQHKYQIACTDLQMPGFDGIQFLRRVQAKRRPIAVIIITDQATIEQAVLVMRLELTMYWSSQLMPRIYRRSSSRPTASARCNLN